MRVRVVFFLYMISCSYLFVATIDSKLVDDFSQACRDNRYEEVRQILNDVPQKSVLVNALNSDGFTALMEVVPLGSVEIIKIILDSGADPNIVGFLNTTALRNLFLNDFHDEDRIAKVLVMLFDKGADPYKGGMDGERSVIQYVIATESKALCSLLLKYEHLICHKDIFFLKLIADRY